MTIQLYSIEHAPVALPIWHAILEDLGQPPPARVARVLGLGLRTIYRYNQTGQAPRVACLALFWLTQWGRSAVDAQAVNDARMAVAYAQALQREFEAIQAEMRYLRAIGRFGSANDPSLSRTGGQP